MIGILEGVYSGTRSNGRQLWIVFVWGHEKEVARKEMNMPGLVQF